MNKKTRRVIIQAVLWSAFLAIVGCGGGFRGDSDNADAFNHPLFGIDEEPDSAATGD